MHNDLWQQFLLSRRKNRLSHALLLTGSPPVHLQDLAAQMAACLLCKADEAPCGQCQSCHLVQKREHPDWHAIVPDKEGSVIKIEQIRHLQTMITTSPQLGKHRVILISPAEKLNTAAANALLKMLEEPVDNTCFLLLAGQISTIPATILSRCQQWRTSSIERMSADYLTQQAIYSPDSPRGMLLAEADTLVGQLNTLCDRQLDVNALAQVWTAHPFADLIWLLYIIHAHLIRLKLCREGAISTSSANMLMLVKNTNIVQLFAQLDKLHGIIRKLNHTFSMNQLLVLEEFLLGYPRDEHRSHDDKR